MNATLSYDEFVKWTKRNCPHIFCGVHNWVYTILTGSKMPSEQVIILLHICISTSVNRLCLSVIG